MKNGSIRVYFLIHQIRSNPIEKRKKNSGPFKKSTPLLIIIYIIQIDKNEFAHETSLNINYFLTVDFTNKHVRILIKNWRKLQGTLISRSTAKFVATERYSDFRAWMDQHMIQLGKFGNEQGMYPLTYIVSIMGNTPMILFQYRHIKSLVRTITQQHNVFCPWTRFEYFLADASYNKKKILANI